MAEPGCSTRLAKRSAPPTRKASASAFDGRISWAAVLPPYSWIAAYLMSPAELDAADDIVTVDTGLADDRSTQISADDIENLAGQFVVSHLGGKSVSQSRGFGGQIGEEFRGKGAEPRIKRVGPSEAKRQHLYRHAAIGLQ